MRRIFVLVIFILVRFAFGQSATSCPSFEITAPGGGYMGRGNTYYLTVSGEVLKNESLKYEWRLPERLQFKDSGKGYIWFVAHDDLDGLEVDVKLRVIGLPQKCKSETVASFQIRFDPGSPLVLYDYENLKPKDEAVRLDNVASELARLDMDALVLIKYKPTETKQSVTARLRRIVTRLVDLRGIDKKRFSFSFYPSRRNITTIYAVPSGTFPGSQDWAQLIRELRLPGRRGR